MFYTIRFIIVGVFIILSILNYTMMCIMGLHHSSTLEELSTWLLNKYGEVKYKKLLESAGDEDMLYSLCLKSIDVFKFFRNVWMMSAVVMLYIMVGRMYGLL